MQTSDDHPLGFTTSRIPFKDRSGVEIWPNGARMAVLVYSAVEEWDWSAKEPFSPPGAFIPEGERSPSLTTQSAVSYGFNVGIHRLMEIFDQFDMKITLWTNGCIAERHPSLLRELVSAGHEIGAHGFSQGQPMSTLSPEVQQDTIRQTAEALGSFSGVAPKGWLGPGAVATRDTVKLIAEAGFEYHGDLQDDELPYFMHVGDKTLVEIPYRMVGNKNDFPLFTRHVQAVSEGIRNLREAFDSYHRAAARRPLIFNYGTHPYVSGRPDYTYVLEEFLGYVHSHEDVWVCTYGELASWWRDRFSSCIVPGGGAIDVQLLQES